MCVKSDLPLQKHWSHLKSSRAGHMVKFVGAIFDMEF